MEWEGRNRSEIHASIREELSSVLADAHGNAGAFRSHKDALKARDELMHEKIVEATLAVQRRAYHMRPQMWKKLLETDWISEVSDVRGLGAQHRDSIKHRGPAEQHIKYRGPGEPSAKYDLASQWAKAFPDAKHNTQDNNQAHYSLCWGSLEHADFKVETDTTIKSCEEIDTRIRCWVEPVALV